MFYNLGGPYYFLMPFLYICNYLYTHILSLPFHRKCRLLITFPWDSVYYLSTIVYFQFVSGEKFQFTLTWAARNYPTITGSVTHNISRDDSKLITAEIRGITGEVDSRKKFMLFSKVNMKKDQLTDTVSNLLIQFLYTCICLNSGVNSFLESHEEESSFWNWTDHWEATCYAF